MSFGYLFHLKHRPCGATHREATLSRTSLRANDLSLPGAKPGHRMPALVATADFRAWLATGNRIFGRFEK